MNLIDINIQKFFKNKEQKTLTTSNSNNSGIILSQLENKVDRWEDWDGDLKVLGKTYSDNFLFSTDEDIDGESGTGGTGGGSITGLSFTGRTLTLSQTSLANLTATFNLIENDIPSLSISKINGLQNALESSSYVHPAKLWTNKAELTGASVISNIIVDALGHPTDWETRIITPASIGAEATLIKSNIVQGDGISLSGSLINKLIGSGSATFSVDNTVIRTFGNQTINGVKTFTENVIAKNLIFSLADNVEGGSTGTGGNVTGISFTGKTLTLTQTNLANLTATFSLIESDIPTLQISKISGLQTALNNATYVHPSKNWVDKTALTGANVISNISIDSLGHPTNWTTRTLTASNIGAEPTLVKSNIIQGDGLTLTGSLVNKLIGSGNITFSLDGTVIRNFGNQTIGGLKTFTENVIGKNFIFSLNEDVEGGSSGIGGNVTGLSFSGKTLTLSQSNLANLTASFSLIESDIPSLSISKTTGLQDALNAKSNTNHIHQYNDIQNKPDLNNTVNLIDININSLNGIGTIESQVATYINANQNVVRNLTSSKLYIRLIGTNPTPTPATPTPTPTATPVPTATPTVTATPTPTVTATPTATPTGSGLILYYDFGNTASYSEGNSNINDLSGIGNNATIQGTIGINYNPDNGGFVRFETAKNHWISTSKTNSQFGIQNGSYSIVFVAKRYSGSGEQLVFGNAGTSATRSMLQGGYIDSTVRFDHFNAGISTGNVTNPSTWYHITMTYDFATSTGRIYINGVLSQSGSMLSLTGNQEVILGRYASNTQNVDLGLAQIYNKTLNSTEITNLFNTQKTRFGI